MATQVKLTPIPGRLRFLTGPPDANTRTFRRQGSYEEMVEWFDYLCVPLKVTISPGSAAVYAGITREGVYRRMRSGQLTTFCFLINKKKQTVFGGKKLLKAEPIVFVSVLECQQWRAELEARAARITASRKLAIQEYRVRRSAK